MTRLSRSVAGFALAAGVASLASTLMAQTDYPHAFPRKGVTQILDNDRVSVWEVNWRYGDKQPVHRHKYDMAGVYLRYGPITVTDLDGKENTGAEFPVPRPYFQPKGITHREEAVTPGAPERLAVMIDLKDAVTDMMVIDDPEPSAYPRDGAKNVLENPRIRMWDYTFTAGAPAVKRVYRSDVVEVVVTEGVVKVTGFDGKADTRKLAPKQARYITRGTVQTEQAVSGSPRVIAVELK
ncbi:MAG: hypothetical protein U0P30_04035 [Vicinamibacterales bacterium]